MNLTQNIVSKLIADSKIIASMTIFKVFARPHIHRFVKFYITEPAIYNFIKN